MIKLRIKFGRFIAVFCLPLIFWSLSTIAARPKQSEDALLEWSKLPPIPGEEGFSGMFGGVSVEKLIVAGGTNFNNKRGSSEGGHKKWSDLIYILDEPGSQWQLAAKRLPRALAYGVSVSFEDGIIFAGGSDGVSHYSDVFMLRWVENRLEFQSLPSLPKPCAFMSGSVLGSTLYIAGGRESPHAVEALHSFWSLDLSKPSGQLSWQELMPWPGPARMLAISAVQDNSFFLFSGMEIEVGEDSLGQKLTPYLNDAYRYEPFKGGIGKAWKRVADLPRSAVAAASPAMALGQSHIAVFGGSDSSQLRTDLTQIPKVQGNIHLYHTITDTWSRRGLMPVGTAGVTLPAVAWNDGEVYMGAVGGPSKGSPDVYFVKRKASQSNFGFINWIVLSGYLVAMLGIGFYFSKREQSINDFFLAGRRIPWWAAGLSIFGTQLSALTFMAIPAMAYATDWSALLKSFGILFVAPFVIYFYLPFFRQLNVTTAYEYLEKRFNVIVRLYGMLKFLITQLLRVGVLLYLPAVALSAVTGMDPYLCVIVISIFCTAYTVMGGMEAVVWSDVIQVLVLALGSMLCLFLILFEVGGIGEIIRLGTKYEKFRTFNWSFDPTAFSVWVLIVGPFFQNLGGYTTEQTVVQRYLSTKTEKDAARGIWTNALISIPTILIFYPLGTGLFAFYRKNPERLMPDRNDAILPYFIVNELPPGLAGLLIAGIFAAVMSSMDSSMNSVSASLVNDFFHRFNKRKVSEKASLRLARCLTVSIGVIGCGAGLLLLTFDIRLIIFQLIAFLGLIAGGLTGVFILGIFTQRANSIGVLCGAGAGFVGPFLVKNYTDLNIFLYAPIGVLSCVTIGYIVSILTPFANKDVEGLSIQTLNRAG